MPSVAQANDWPQLGLDGTRARASTEVSGTPFRPAWQVTAADGAIVSSPMVADGYVVVAGAKGQLRALHAFDGTTAWSATAAGPLGASPAIDRGRIFVPTLSGKLQAFGLEDGQPLWSRAFGGQNYGSPAVVGDSLVLAAGFPAQKMVRLATADGATQWETAPGAVADLVSSSAAVGQGQVLFGMNGGRYQSLDFATGVTTWKVDTNGSVNLSAPLVIGQTAYFVPGGNTAALYGVDRNSGSALAGFPVAVTDPSLPAGTVLWKRHAVSSPVAVGELVVFQIRFEYGVQGATPGIASTYALNEYAVAVGAGSGQVAWQRQTGARQVDNINQIPELNMAPTPASFASGGNALVAVTSSVSATLRVLDGATGSEVWSAALSGPTRSSPVFANGLLLVATDAGVVHAFESTVNRAPAAPVAGFEPAASQMVETLSPTLRWTAAQDEDAQGLVYQVRVGSDAGLLRGWLFQTETAAGQPQAALPHGIVQAGGAYVYAVRSRDAQGAWSAWSAPQSFLVALTPKIDVAGTSYDTLGEAIAAAPPGGVVNLGPGLLHLKTPVQLPAGVSLQGAGPDRTLLDATGSSIGIQVSANGRTGASQVKGVTVANADVGVQVTDAEKAVLRNVVLHDNKTAGLEVGVHGGAELVNATLVRNGTGALCYGKLAVRNSIVTDNEVGLAQAGAGALTSRYNDLVANRTQGYLGAEPGVGDISATVRFAAAARQDFRLQGLQATTDQGDPADDFALEPAPNGARVNMGAFGDTPLAELSAAAAGWSAAGDAAGGGQGGCNVAGGTGRPGLAALVLLAIAVTHSRRRRSS